MSFKPCNLDSAAGSLAKVSNLTAQYGITDKNTYLLIGMEKPDCKLPMNAIILTVDEL